jgi:hypothetical protein
MARVAAQLTNFTAGELSPRLDGRNDLAKYSAGCATVEKYGYLSSWSCCS